MTRQNQATPLCGRPDHRSPCVHCMEARRVAVPKNLDANDVAQTEGPEAIRRALKSRTIPLIRPGSFTDGDTPTEESLAREWVAIHRQNWRFDHTLGRWYRWDETRWQRDEANLARHLIGEHLRAAAAGNKKASSVPRAGVAKGVEYFAQVSPHLAVAHDQWDVEPFLLGTPAGTVNLQTGMLEPAKREHNITRSTAVAPAPGEPKRWLQFIREATNGDEALARFLQQTLGYCLTGSTREHALFQVIGDGGNGKSVFLNTAARIMGDYATTAAMDTFIASKGNRHLTEIAHLDGARMVTASETTEGQAWDETRIKQLTGGDRMSARFMRQDLFEFTPRLKLLIAANNAPVLHNVDDAMRRRFNIIPFAHKPANPDRELEDKLAAEHPQILQWMITGCRDWLANGLLRPPVVESANTDYFSGQDILGQWIDEYCQREAETRTLKRSAFDSWCKFAGMNNYEHGTQNAFSRKMAKRGFADGHSMAGAVFVGLKLIL